jgi:hypothetical protein
MAEKEGALLLRSGIGVEGPFLVIAPPGNPAIRLDARLLDRIDLVGRSPTGAYVASTLAVGGVVAGCLSLMPGGYFVAAGMAYLAQERFVEGRRRTRSRDLLLALGDLEVALHVADGAAAAKRIADQLAPFARSAPITRPEVYQDARRRLQNQAAGKDSELRVDEQTLTVGEDTVRVVDGALMVGAVSFRVDEVRDYALRGANLPLPGGRLLQAAMGLLVVAAEERARKGEDLEALSRRISAYEKWSGQVAGR